MPRLWNDTIDAHRREVRDAILDATAALAFAQGPMSVTMSQVAEHTGIGRATLYKYFKDVETILHAWHERQIHRHLGQLTEVRDRVPDPGTRLAAVLAAYARICHESRDHRDTELAALMHQSPHVAQASHQLRGMIQELVAEAAQAGQLRADIEPDELASYCLHALTAASNLPSEAAVRRLVEVTLAGLRPLG